MLLMPLRPATGPVARRRILAGALILVVLVVTGCRDTSAPAPALGSVDAPQAAIDSPAAKPTSGDKSCYQSIAQTKQACGQNEALPDALAASTAISPAQTPAFDGPAYLNPNLSPADRAADIVERMTLAEKVGQMTQVEKNSIAAKDITRLSISSLLSGGSGYPEPNTPERWLDMVNGFQGRALKSRLGIPLIYGVDAVHGHSTVVGATVFPQQIGLGAANDPDLVRRIGEATAAEMAATGLHWNFAPVVAVPQDIRWGRTFEAYGEDTALVSSLAAASVEGLQAGGILATPKHFVADGGTTFGSSKTVIIRPYLLDQGDARIDEATLRRVHLPPYQAAIEAGAQSIMVSFSSWNGEKMHANHTLLTDVLKGELGFQGFLVSDWQATEQLPGDYHEQIVTAINAGVDMVMVPFDYDKFIANLTGAVNAGEVPVSRIDDAVRRILTVKFAFGLFDRPLPDESQLGQVGAASHRDLAREAVRKSIVLLKNDGAALPLSKETPLVFVAGRGAKDIGIQSGGWTIEWQGHEGAITTGTTLLEGIRQVAPAAKVEYDPLGVFSDVKDASGEAAVADVGIAVVAERPYAEGVGDSKDLALPLEDMAAFKELASRSRMVVLVIVSGRPVMISDLLPAADAAVAVWLPGSEGEGMADVLFGDAPFTGKLSYTWPRSVTQLPFDFEHLPANGCDAPLFPRGYGLAGGETETPDTGCE